MLHYAVVFFVIALIAALFGFGGIAAGAAGIAKILFSSSSSWRSWRSCSVATETSSHPAKTPASRAASAAARPFLCPHGIASGFESQLGEHGHRRPRRPLLGAADEEHEHVARRCRGRARLDPRQVASICPGRPGPRPSAQRSTPRRIAVCASARRSSAGRRRSRP